MPFFLRHDGDGEAVLDGLGVRVILSEFLGGTLEVCAGFLDICLEFLVVAVELLVERQVRVVQLGVLLPCVGGRTTDDDLESVVLNRAGEVRRFTLLTNQFLHGCLYLRTQRFQGCFTLVHAQLSAKELVNDL